MKEKTFSDALLAEHRSHINSDEVEKAFDVLVSAAISSKKFECAPGWHGDVRDFRYFSPVTKDQPFAFIPNRKDLLFYVRKPGKGLIVGGLKGIRDRFQEVNENSSGEWTIRLRTPAEAARMNDVISSAGELGTPAGLTWSLEEVEAVVADYFHMLSQELSGQSYSKTAHRRSLVPKLAKRSEGSIELKHQNISAILLEVGAPWVLGYKPRKNYQNLLRDQVISRLKTDQQWDATAVEAMEQQAVPPLIKDYSSVVVPAPDLEEIRESAVIPYVRREIGIKRDYFELEARNRSLGCAGEEFVVGYERNRLMATGRHELAARVERVSETKGDGLGFDVLSYEKDGRERFIEVKTTALGKEAPFYVTQNELEFSRSESDRFKLYRLFSFRREPKLFQLSGELDKACYLDPTNYRARFR